MNLIVFHILMFVHLIDGSQIGTEDELGEFVNETVIEFQERYNLPGLAVGVVTLDTTYISVSGVKRNGLPDPISLHSKFQLSSNTKAITASIAADLVENGFVEWDTKLLDLVPELNDCNESFKNVTLSELISHRAMLPAFEDSKSKEWKGIPKDIENERNPRLAFAKYALSLEPITTELNHAYSNAGYIIASLMMEQVTNKKWEQLVMDFSTKAGIKIFCGYPSEESSDATYGHKKIVGNYKSVSFEDEYDLGSYFSPAGNMSLDITSFSSFVKLNLTGLSGMDNILKSKTYEYLHYGLDSYSMGWYNGKIGDTGDRFSYHGGSLGTFSSAVLISPDREVAIVILVNADGKAVANMKEELRIKLWNRFNRT